MRGLIDAVLLSVNSNAFVPA